MFLLSFMHNCTPIVQHDLSKLGPWDLEKKFWVLLSLTIFVKTDSYEGQMRLKSLTTVGLGLIF